MCGDRSFSVKNRIPVTPISVNELRHHRSRWWLFAWLFDQCWIIVNRTLWNKLRRNFNQITTTSIPWSTIQKSSAKFPLRWRHNGRNSVSNHQPHDCLLNRLFRRRSKKTSKLRVTGLCVGNSPGTGEFPAQMASNAENVSIWWRHHAFMVSRPNYVKCEAVGALALGSNLITD